MRGLGSSEKKRPPVFVRSLAIPCFARLAWHRSYRIWASSVASMIAVLKERAGSLVPGEERMAVSLDWLP